MLHSLELLGRVEREKVLTHLTRSASIGPFQPPFSLLSFLIHFLTQSYD